MIVVDTSVWVDALRHRRSPSARALGELLDADEVGLPLPVRIELLAGVSRKDRAALARALSALPVLRPSDETWNIVEGWVEGSAARGECFALSDLLVGALAHEAGSLVWSADRDFERMAKLRMVHLYA